MSTDKTLSLASLPALKQPLEGGIFCGVITLPDGKHYAVVKLDAKPETRLDWKADMKWAKGAGGRLPSRAIAALLFSVANELFSPGWYWTDEPEGSSHAWNCLFGYGTQSISTQSYEGLAVAVRLIPLTSSPPQAKPSPAQWRLRQPAEPIDERKAFEAWAKSGGASYVDRLRNGQYAATAHELAWQGWLARAALKATPAEDGSTP